MFSPFGPDGLNPVWYVIPVYPAAQLTIFMYMSMNFDSTDSRSE